MANGGRESRTAVVTGGSSGIGLALARLFVRDGYHVVLVAREKERLEEAARGLAQAASNRVTTLPLDLGQPDAAEPLFRELDARHLVPDVVVNNAGFGLRGAFATTDMRRELEMIQVNVTTLTATLKLALQRMLPLGRGRILNVASTAAFQPGPFMAVYYATKAYVLSLSEAVANETRGTGVTITTLCPGPTATRFEERSGMTGSRLFSPGVQGVDSVARQGYDGLMAGKRLVIPGLRNRLMVQALRISPRAAVLAVARRLQE